MITRVFEGHALVLLLIVALVGFVSGKIVNALKGGYPPSSSWRRLEAALLMRALRVLARRFISVFFLAESALLASQGYAFPSLDQIDTVRSELGLETNRLKALSDAERGFHRGSQNPPPVLPVLRYDVVNFSEGDSQDRVDGCLEIAGVDGVIHRSSMGTDGVDRAYNSRSTAAVHGNYRWGAYHFLRPKGSGEEQAIWFLKTLLKSSDHPKSVLLVIDAEYLHGSNSPHPTLAQIMHCVRKVHALTGVYPGIYTGQDFLWEQFNKARYDSATQDEFKNTWLWVARYSASYKQLTFPVVSLPFWSKWTLWQVSDENNATPMFEGMRAEINVFKGERSDLEKFWDDHSWDYKLRAPLN
jgi:GH25 family lysozyme M1 (1,4-beta-N-acetylmuramidase)